MSDQPALEDFTDSFVDALRDALEGRVKDLPPLPGPNLPAARAGLDDLVDRSRAVSDADNLGGWAGAMDAWYDRFRQIAADAFGGGTPEEAALVRFLEQKMPRTAAFFGLIGVIQHRPDGDHVDRSRLHDLLTDPATLVNESLWDALLDDTGLPGTGRLPAVLMALVVLAPQTVIALSRGDLKVAQLEAPPTDQPGPWRNYREATENWLSLTVPLGDPARPAPFPADLYDYVADLSPDLTGTIAMRSDRVLKPAGGRRTLFELWLAVAVESDRWQYDLGSDWYVRAEPGLAGGFGYDGDWHGAFRQFVLDPAKLPGPGDPLVISLGRDRGPSLPDLYFGPPYDTRFIIEDLGLYLKVREDHPIFEIGLFVHGFQVVLTNRWWRTFGISDTLFRDGIKLALELDIAYVEGRGLVLNTSAGLDLTFGIEWEVGKNSAVGFKLHTITLRVPFRATEDGFDVRGELTFHVSVKLGPVILVVSGLGGWGGLWTEDGHRKYAGFIPPTGAGLQITAGPFTGGGFLDFTGGPNERFGGLVYVKFGGFEITAFGLHELTGHPGDPDRRTSLIMVLGVRFAPGIPLSFFIEISGFGGLVGINRRADTDALRERLTSGAAGNMLFAEDPIRNAPSILGDLDTLFPANPGTHVFGPTMQLSWLNLAGYKVVKLDLGLFFEFPGPTKIILLGSARATVPPIADVPHLIELRFDIVGFVDFPKKIIEFDATLISSKVMQVLNMTGDLALRIAWGDPPYMLLSFGGFHPNFKPLPAQFPELTRLALTVKPGFFSAGIFFRAEAYLAITSNTVQFGGRIEVGYAAGPLNLVGFVSLDALFQFSPFHFEVAISAGVRLRWNSTTLAGVRLEGVISGPGPIRLTGRACFEILWFDICAEASITLGEIASAAAAAVASICQELLTDLSDPANLTTDGGDDPNVARQSQPLKAGPAPVMSPLGTLRWTQKRVPLNLLVERFEGQPLANPQRVEVVSGAGLGTVRDWFAPGSFTNLSQSEALNRPGFERLDGGISLSPGVRTQSAAVRHEVKVIEIRLPRRTQVKVSALAFAGVILDAIGARTGACEVRTTEPTFVLHDEEFVVKDAAGVRISGGLTVSEAHQQARALGVSAVHALDVVDLGAF